MTKQHEQTAYVFGPVPSRRLGRSLGVDLVPYKHCPYDCLYCQIGRTTHLAVDRDEWVPLKNVVEQIRNRLDAQPDYITLSGSGEPTLYSPIGELIAAIKAITDVPVAVLTNGSLLQNAQVRNALLQADLVAPSLDAGSEDAYQAVNRPHESLSFATMLEGLVAFRSEYTGQYWLEVLFLKGINDSDAEVERIGHCIGRIKPDRVQLNTVTRPPAESIAQPVPVDRLAQIAETLATHVDHVEIIADYKRPDHPGQLTAGAGDVLAMLARRPCSLDDIAAGLAIHRNEAVKYIQELTERGQIEPEVQNKTTYYKPNQST